MSTGAQSFEAQGKRVFFDGNECIDPYHIALIRFMASPLPREQRQLWMQETENGPWCLVFTRDSPDEPVRNPTLEETLASFRERV